MKPLWTELVIPVRTYDIDFSGVVSNLAAVRWLEDLRLTMGVAHCPLERMLEEGIAPTVVKTEISYMSPVRLGDTVVGSMWVGMSGTARWTVEARITVNGRLAVTGRQTLCFSKISTGRVVRIPSWMREKYESDQGPDLTVLEA